MGTPLRDDQPIHEFDLRFGSQRSACLLYRASVVSDFTFFVVAALLRKDEKTFRGWLPKFDWILEVVDKKQTLRMLTSLD